MATASSQPLPMPGDPGSASQQVPAYKLYDPVAVGIAAFLGSAILGTALMAINYRHLGRRSAALWSIVIGTAATVLVVACANWIPSWAGTAVGLALFLGTYNAAKSLQGATVARHEQLGGRIASRWIAAGLGVLALAAWAAIYLFALGQSKKVTIGSNDSVYYAGSATRQDAQALGDKLKAISFFSDRGAAVMLSKGADGTVVSFVMQDGAWNQPAMVAGIEEVGREIAPTVGGFPITVRMANTLQQTRKQMAVGEVVAGTKDELYYYGSATLADAQAVAKALTAASYFRDRGVSVFLNKDDSGTAVSFVVAPGVWDNPRDVADYQDLVRQSIAPVLGVPVTLRLVDAQQELKKSIVISSLKP